MITTLPSRIAHLRLATTTRRGAFVCTTCLHRRALSVTARVAQSNDPRVRDLGREISDDYASIRSHYSTPKHPVVLAHGLFGFSELSLTSVLPAVQYWHGIKEALVANGTPVIATSVPPSGSIEERAAKLSADIAAAFAHPSKTKHAGSYSASHSPASLASEAKDTHSDAPAVNIIAHSMGGLDARHMITHNPPPGIRIASLTTVATPHRGSAFADYVLDDANAGNMLYLPKLYGLLRRAGFGTDAFRQLTRAYVEDEFNPRTPDAEDTRYFSFGAAIDIHEPSSPPGSEAAAYLAPLPLLSPLRQSHAVISQAEGPNDGLVSVGSSRWGEYRGTLMGVSHLDLINWTNRMRWTVREWMGMKKSFNAVALYLDIADMLAKEGL